MKSSTLICLCLIAVAIFMAAYLIGRDSQRLTEVQGDVGKLKVQVNELRADKLRNEGCWQWLAWIGSQIPVVRRLLHR